MSFLKSLLWAVLLVVCSAVATPLAANDQNVLVLGDSLSAAYGIPREQGWVSLLRQRLADAGYPHQVVNASVSGDTTSGGLARLPRALERNRPALVIIALGANDGLRAVSRDAMRDNLRAMVELSRQEGARVLLVGMRLPPNYGAAYTEEFHRTYHELADSLDVALVPFLLEGLLADDVLDETLLQDDGIHPTASAQPLLLEAIWTGLEPLLENTREAGR